MGRFGLLIVSLLVAVALAAQPEQGSLRGTGAFLIDTQALLANAPPGSTLYTVKPGDNLPSIAKAQGVKLKDLRAANANVDGNHMQPGDVIVIPPKA